jgi:hypothetical protein
MSSRKTWLIGLAVIVFGVSPGLAQVPGLPSGTGGVPPMSGGIPATASGLGTAAPSAAPTTGLSGFGANLSTLCQKLKAALCASQFGQMLTSGMTGPLAGVTGGFIPSICPPPSASQAAALGAAQPGSAAAAAAAIQASEANAKARVAAIEYLGTVDCARWPEAKAALINGLRKDTNECVRFAAARALNSGCCCDKKVIDALRICVSGETTDDAPAENSLRVKAAAFSALQNCLMKVPEELPPETKPPLPEGDRPNLVPLPPAPENPAHVPAANPRIAASYNPQRRRTITYDDQLQRQTFGQTVEEARRTLFQVSKHPRSTPAIQTGQRSLFSDFTRARNEVNVARLRRAREQGLVPPRPVQAPFPPDRALAASAPAGVTTTGIVVPQPVTGFAPQAVSAVPAAGLIPGGGSENPGPMSDAEPMPAPTPRSAAHRGLIGMLFQSRDN